LDDLNTPLAGPAARRRLWRLPVTAPQVAAGALALFLIVFVAWSMLADNPLGGEPFATASLQAIPKGGSTGKPGHARHDGSEQGKKAELPPGRSTVTIIDGSNGQRQEVIISGPSAPAAQQKSETDIDETLLETTRHGRIPRIAAAGGRRAIDAYARPAAPAEANPTATRIAIVVAGLGISAAGTADALSRLPPAITLAFAPYGANLDSLSGKARQLGHEVLLQAPMEPFDYPDNDSGPQTLLTTLSAEQNIDRLHWVMSRMQGYVGLTNSMGARFTASDKALRPVLDDISKRGLMYLDDGSSARSVASQLASANNMPFVKADEVLDAVATPPEIDRALARLESAARGRGGIAVGTATALPVAIDRIVSWAKDAEARGVVLVPITAAAVKPKSS
jgi:hypothetical protein